MTQIVMHAAISLHEPTAQAEHFMGLALGFAELGHRVVAIVPKISDPKLCAELRASHIELTEVLLPRGVPISLAALPGAIIARRRLRRVESGYLYSRLGTLSWVVLRLAPRNSIRISEHNGWVAAEASISGISSTRGRLRRTMQLRDAKAASAIRTVTYGLRDRLVAAGVPNTKIFVVGNGGDLRRFQPIARHREAAPHRYLIGYLGSLESWQGVDVAVRALPLVLKELPDCRMVIGGSGPAEPSLRLLARRLNIDHALTFAGRIDRSDANIFLNRLDLALCPLTSLRNAEIGVSPVKIRNYAAAGCAILAAAVPGILQHEEEGWLETHRPDDPADLARGIVRLLHSSERREALSRRARAYALAEFGWGALAREVLSHAARFDQVRSSSSSLIC